MAGLVSVFLPETAQEALPDTLEEGRDFGRGQKLWSIPGLVSKKNASHEEARNARALGGEDNLGLSQIEWARVIYCHQKIKPWIYISISPFRARLISVEIASHIFQSGSISHLFSRKMRARDKRKEDCVER